MLSNRDSNPGHVHARASTVEIGHANMKSKATKIYKIVPYGTTTKVQTNKTSVEKQQSSSSELDLMSVA